LFTLVAFKVVGDPNSVTTAFYTVLPKSFTNFFALDMGVFTTYLLTLGVFYLTDPWMYMWAYVGESPRVSSNGMLAVLGGSYYNVLPFISGMTILVGVTMGKFSMAEGLSGDALYTWFVVKFADSLPGVIILVGLLMTIVSCGSSFAMNGVTILTKDIYLKVINKNATDKQALNASRISVIIVVGVGIASALWLPILVPLWVLAQAIVISGLFATTMSAWFWKRATTAGAMTSTVGGAIAALAWAMYAWVTTGSPGTLIGGFHAVHIGVIVSIPLMIIVSLGTKPDYEKAALTNWKVLGEEIKTSDLIPEYDKPQRGGFFGWLCADTPVWKIFWIVVVVVFAAHYVMSLGFQVETLGHAMVWAALTVGTLMIFMMAILGGRDLIGMAKKNKQAMKEDG